MLKNQLLATMGGAPANYIEDVFSTYLYTGNGSTQTITNGIDLAGKGGLVWIKQRNSTAISGGLPSQHLLFDTNRGANNMLASNSTYQSLPLNGYSFNNTGFTVAQYTNTDGTYPYEGNQSSVPYASWTFRKQPKFFDVVTWTGNNQNPRVISHNLGSVPGAMFIKATSTTANNAWYVYHTSFDGSLKLNTTAAGVGGQPWYRNDFTSTTISVTDTVNATGVTYVAYLFAHNAGGFGLTGTDNVISCGSVNIDATGYFDHNLGWEPQFLLWKKASAAEGWYVFNTMSGMPQSGLNSFLQPNTVDAEGGTAAVIVPTATGFKNLSTGTGSGASSTYIYIAIRRGPMKVPTSGASVFAPVAYTGTNVDNRLVNTGIVTDMAMARIRTATSTGGFYIADRLMGHSFLGSAVTDAENTLDGDSFMTPTVGYGNPFSAMDGFGVGNDLTRQLNQASTSQFTYAFKRAPSFFDEVCYTGTGVARTVAHNLGAVPELMIVKSRGSVTNWRCYVAPLGNTNNINLDSTGAVSSGPTIWNSTTPTSSVFSVGTSTTTNASAGTYVAYLFATCAGVSKVGSYTGTATTKQVDCGFTSGARFVLIKRTDSAGDWYVWDSARGIVAGNDPYLLLNSTAAEVTTTDYIDPVSSGFEISSTAPAAINASGGSFIFLAIA